MAKSFFIKESMPKDDVEKLFRNAGLSYVMNELYETDNFFKKKTVAFVGKILISSDKHTDNTGKKKPDEDAIIYSAPKYIDDDILNSAVEGDSDCQKKIIDQINKILEILLILKRNEADIYSENVFMASNKEKKKDLVDKLSLADYIIRDYVNHGLYCEDKSVTGIQSKGKIHWGSTIKKCRPFIDGDTVLYMKLMHKYRMQDAEQMITLIHASAVHYAFEMQSQLNDRTVSMSKGPFLEEKDLNRLESVVSNYLLKAVSNRDIFLFRALEAWCRESFHYTNLTLGTTSFNLVWETVNDSVFGNYGDKESSEPTYYFFSGSGYKSFRGTGTSKIDTIFVDNKKAPEFVSVFDSKYYYPRDFKNGIEGYPANSDIAKQTGYLDIVKRAFGKTNKNGNPVRYSNSFLLPAFADSLIKKYNLPPEMSISEWKASIYRIVGLTTRGKFSNNDKDNYPVLLIHVDPEKLYDDYLNGKKISPDDIKAISNAYDKAANLCSEKDVNNKTE